MPSDSSSPLARFEDHVGELELALEADTLEDLFAEAARVVSRECGETEGPPGPWERIELASQEPATLLADWLNELIGRSEVEHRAYGEVRGLTLRNPRDAVGAAPGEGWRLVAEVRGRTVRSWESALKAATYHGLELARREGRWRARVLFDV
jgi:SHS2 domain-containing protein